MRLSCVANVEEMRVEGIEADVEARAAEFVRVAQIDCLIELIVESIAAAGRDAVSKMNAGLRRCVRQVHHDQLPGILRLPIIGDQIWAVLSPKSSASNRRHAPREKPSHSRFAKAGDRDASSAGSADSAAAWLSAMGRLDAAAFELALMIEAQARERGDERRRGMQPSARKYRGAASFVVILEKSRQMALVGEIAADAGANFGRIVGAQRIVERFVVGEIKSQIEAGGVPFPSRLRRAEFASGSAARTSGQNSRGGGAAPASWLAQVCAKMSLSTSMAMSQRKPSQCFAISRKLGESARRASRG